MSINAKYYATVGLALVLGCLSMNEAVNAAGNNSKNDALSARWWQHVASFTVSESPVNDDTGSRCNIGQRGTYWFLYGSFGNDPGFPTVRDCEVPVGSVLIIPIVNTLCIPFPGETIPDNRAICKDFIDLAESMSLEVDGKDVSHLIRRRTQSAPIVISMPEENIYDFPTEGQDAPAGTYVGVADGFYAKMRLPKGRHTVHIRGEVPAYGFALDVIYNLNIVRPARFIDFR